MKNILEKFFNSKYDLENINISSGSNPKIRIILKGEYENYYFEKCKIFHYKTETEDLYDDISCGGPVFMDIKISRINNEWKKYLNENR